METMRFRTAGTLCLAGTFLFTGTAGAADGLFEENIQKVEMELSEYRFEPAQIEIAAGRETELILTNRGSVLHEFIPEGFHQLNVGLEIRGVLVETMGILEIEIPPKESVTLRFFPEKPGEYRIACRAREPKDHFKEGMTGRLVIR